MIVNKRSNDFAGLLAVGGIGFAGISTNLWSKNKILILLFILGFKIRYEAIYIFIARNISRLQGAPGTPSVRHVSQGMSNLR